MIVTRYDNGGTLERPVELPNGYLRVDGFISRTGCQSYERADGTTQVEYRPPEEVFAPETLASFEAVPLTNNHPSTPLNAHNTRAYQVGSVLNPRQDGTRTRATMLITDAKAIEALRAGRQELSCGYSASLEFSPGVAPDGTHYDAIQRRVSGNHVALVDAGRAGPECRVRLDSAGAIVDAQVKVLETSTQSQPTLIESEVIMDELKKAIESQAKAEAALAALQARMDASDKALAAAQARADMAEAEAKAAPAREAAKLKARTELEAKAKAALPSVKCDGTDDSIRGQVVEACTGVKCDGRGSDYLSAAFDIACSMSPREDSAPIADVVEQDDNDAVSKAQKAFAARMDASFKKSAV